MRMVYRIGNVTAMNHPAHITDFLATVGIGFDLQVSRIRRKLFGAALRGNWRASAGRIGGAGERSSALGFATETTLGLRCPDNYAAVRS